jgi:hypothetical protein
LLSIHEHQSTIKRRWKMSVRAFVAVMVIVIPVFLFSSSCDKEQPTSEELAVEHSSLNQVDEELGQPGFLPNEYMDRGEDEDAAYRLAEDEGEDEGYDLYEGEDEGTPYEHDQDGGEDESIGFEPETEDADESYEPEEEEVEDEGDTVYESDEDEQA